MESANQNRRYHQPWRVEQPCSSNNWSSPISSACMNSLVTRKQIWTSDLGLLGRARSDFLVKPISQQRYADYRSHDFQPRNRDNEGMHHILQQIPSNNAAVRQDFIFPNFYNHFGYIQEEIPSYGTASSRWIAAGSELIKLDPEPISRPLFKSPWDFLQSPSFTLRDQVGDPVVKSTHHETPPMETVRDIEQALIRPSIPYITSDNSQSGGPYLSKMNSSVGHIVDDPVAGLAFPEHHESEYESLKMDTITSLPVSGTIDLTDLTQESQDDSTCDESNKFLLIDDQGIPYTVFKKDLINSPNATTEPEDKSSQIPKKLHYCMVCLRTFLYLSDLERHSITHSERKPHECKVCGKSFKRSSHLQRHKHIHTGEKPFLCTVCHKGFRESGELLRHQRVHTGEKPYQCDICHLRFTERNTLRRHVKRKHSKEMPYQQDAGDSSDWGDVPTEDNME
ncbi:zinc finger protein 524 [Rhinophrynus dorsalis]